MSTRSGRASRAAAPTSFAPPKANRGWGTSRAYAVGGKSGRSTPVRGARSRGARRGALQEKSAAAKRLEASGGVVRRFVRVRRTPLDPLAVGGAAAGSAAGGSGGDDGGVKVWRWVAVEEITDPKERKALGLDQPTVHAVAALESADNTSKEQQQDTAAVSVVPPMDDKKAANATVAAAADGAPVGAQTILQEGGQQENDPTAATASAAAPVAGDVTAAASVPAAVTTEAPPKPADTATSATEAPSKEADQGAVTPNAEAEGGKKEEDAKTIEEEEQEEEFTAEQWAAFNQMTSNDNNPYYLPPKERTKERAVTTALLMTPASTTTQAAAISANMSYAATGVTAMKSATTSAGAGAGASAADPHTGEKRKVRDPAYDSNRLATGLKRRTVTKDKRFQGLPGERPCKAATTRGNPCGNTAAPHSIFCNLHSDYVRQDSDEEGGGGAGAADGYPAFGDGSDAAGRYTYAPSFNRGGGGKWKSDDVTEKCLRYSGQPGHKPCGAVTTRGKPCGFSASMDRGGSMYCPVHRGNFEKDKEKFERQQARSKEDL